MNDEQLTRLLQKMDDRLSRIEKQTQISNSLEQMQWPSEVSILADVVDESLSPTTNQGQANLQKLQQINKLIDAVSQQETLEALVKLTSNLHLISQLTDQLKEVENIVSIVTDSADEVMQKAIASGVNVEELSVNLKVVSSHLIELMESGTLTKLIESGILDKKSIEVVGALGNSLAVSKGHGHSRGLFALLGALFNSDIRRTLGFTIDLAIHFGRKLKRM